MKKRTTALSPRAIALMPCDNCQGSGFVTGVFHRMPCAKCESAGILDKKTGKALPLQELVVQLRLRLNQSEAALADALAEKARATKASVADRGYGVNSGYGPFGQRYHGD